MMPYALKSRTLAKASGRDEDKSWGEVAGEAAGAIKCAPPCCSLPSPIGSRSHQRTSFVAFGV